MKILGYIAGILLAICSLPQVYKVIKDGNSNGISIWFLLIWVSGNISMQVYVINTRGWDFPYLISAWFSDICIFIMLKYKLYPRK